MSAADDYRTAKDKFALYGHTPAHAEHESRLDDAVRALIAEGVREGYIEGYAYGESGYDESDPGDLPEAIVAELLPKE